MLISIPFHFSRFCPCPIQRVSPPLLRHTHKKAGAAEADRATQAAGGSSRQEETAATSRGRFFRKKTSDEIRYPKRNRVCPVSSCPLGRDFSIFFSSKETLATRAHVHSGDARFEFQTFFGALPWQRPAPNSNFGTKFKKWTKMNG
jgi:hypothetical protein